MDKLTLLEKHWEEVALNLQGLRVKALIDDPDIDANARKGFIAVLKKYKSLSSTTHTHSHLYCIHP